MKLLHMLSITIYNNQFLGIKFALTTIFCIYGERYTARHMFKLKYKNLLFGFDLAFLAENYFCISHVVFGIIVLK